MIIKKMQIRSSECLFQLLYKLYSTKCSALIPIHRKIQQNRKKQYRTNFGLYGVYMATEQYMEWTLEMSAVQEVQF